MRYYVCNYQHKGTAYLQALRKAGHEEDHQDPQVALFDRDWYMHNDKEPRREVLKHPQATVMVYPHSALPPWWYDGLIKIQPYVKCVFVIGEGQKRAMREIAPEARVEVTGWPWSELAPFRSPARIRKILFAPIHPASGRLRPEAVEANRLVMAELKGLIEQRRIQVTVRYVGNKFHQGLRRDPAMTWIQGQENNSIQEIDAADVVIAEGTFLYLAVARGRPTIGINQHLPVRANKMSDIYTPHNWSKYGGDLAYPINYGSAPLKDLLEQAAAGEQTEWRRDFIGPEMAANEFAKKVEDIWLDNLPAIRQSDRVCARLDC